MLLSFTGLLGAFGLAIGKQINSMFTGVMGGLAWAGPFLCFVFAISLWVYSYHIKSESSVSSNIQVSKGNSRIPNNSRKRHDQQKSLDRLQDSKSIPLPTGKLVNLQGFNQYFSSPDWVEMKDKDIQKAEEMKEMGRDFPSYFGTGESFLPKKQCNMKILKGFNDYFEEVDQEERLERSVSQKNCFESTKMPRISVEKPANFSSVFKSKTEQEEFLAQFKPHGNLDQRLDSVENLREDSRTIDEVEKKAQVVESSVIKTEIESKLTLNLMPENEAIIETEIEQENSLQSSFVVPFEQNFKGELYNELDSADVPLNACTFHEMSEPEALVDAESVLKSDFVEKTQVVDHTVYGVNNWEFPNFSLLEPLPKKIIIQDTETSKQLEKVLLDFGVKAKVIRVTRGPVITRYELAPAPGVKISKIVNLSDDIALGLAARDVRIEAPIPGKAAIGIEVPNKHALSVPFREVLETSSFGQYPSKLKVALGKDIADQPIIADLIKMPHLLVAGATGSGKSVCITSIINSLLFNATPDEVKLLLVDPKMVELSQYNGIPHLLAPVVIDPKKAASALKWIVKEMENRYELFAASGVRDIERYNRLKAGETSRTIPALPFIVVIIDELADLMMVAAGEVEEAICRLAQMARAAGIHLVIATQRPSVDVITGVIKANIPSRISFAVSSQIDSRTILDATGAEKLLGRGDMLYSPLGVNKALRVQGCLVTDEEVQRVIMHWKELGRPEYLDPERLFAETTVKSEESNGHDDALFINAGQLFIRTSMASVSFLQRRLKLGYTRAARLMDMLEEQGVVGAYEGSKPRQVLLTLEEFNERFG